VQILRHPPPEEKQKLHSSGSSESAPFIELNKRKQLRREETEWANKSKQNLPKNTHTRTLPSSILKTASLSVSFDIHSSVVLLTRLLHLNIHSLHPRHEKPSCVIYTYLFGCLGSNLSLLSSLSSTHHLSSLPVLSLCLSVCQSVCLSLLVPLNRAKLELLGRRSRSPCQSVHARSKLVSANCNELIPFQFSAKTNFKPLLNEFPFLFSWERRTPNLPQSNKIYFKLRIYIHIYQRVASQEEFCCAKQRLFGFCHESQTSHIIPTTPASTF